MKKRNFRRSFDNEIEDKNIKEILNEFTTGNALTDIINNNKNQHKDIILVGYRFKSINAEEED